MTDTPKRTNTEIAKEIVMSGAIMRTHSAATGETMRYMIEALNTKDRERDETVAEAVRREREVCIEIVKTYRTNITKLHEEMVGTTHKDNKHFLAYDMHSRLIAIKHILEALTTPQEGLQHNK